MKKLILIFLIFPIYLYSFIIITVDKDLKKEEEKNIVYNHEIGFHVGTAIGYGIAYRYWNYGLGFQVNLFPYIDFISREANIILGLTFLKEVAYYDWSKLYFYLSICNKFNYNDYGHIKEFSYLMNMCIGPGIEIFFNKNNGFNLLIGIAYYNMIFYNSNPTSSINFNIETSYFYRF